MIRRTAIRKVRSKARPGRLKGAKLENLRRQCFERDGSEDGAKDDWTIVGLSQDEAARMLYLEIHDPPKKAEHRPSDKPESRKHCYRDLTSENFTQKCERCGKP